jgi:photosystem II stability/assembly factor-like uncharacterized protein
MRRVNPFLAFLVLASSMAFAQRQNGFEVIGQGGGGAMFHPTVSPHDSSTVLVACDMTGAYITHDGGASWRMFNLRGVVRFFLFDPSLRNVIYAQNNNLWRSRDNGETWSLVSPTPSSIQSVSMASDHSDEKIITSSDPLGSITALAIDPHDSNHLYAAAGGSSPGLFESADSGLRWARTADLPELANHMWITTKPAKTLLIVGEQHVVEKLDDKVNISSTPIGPLDASAGVTDRGAWTIYVANKSGIAISNDLGSTWVNAALPGNGAQVRAVATSFSHPETAYASYSNLHLDGTLWHGVARTSDAGKTWQLVWKESETAASNVQDAWITERFGTDWGENPLNLTVADQDPKLVYETDFGRTLISGDGGITWHPAYSHRTKDGAWTSNGLDVTTAYGIHFDPFNLNREFITYTDISLFRSETGGKSWTSSSAGVPKSWLNTAYWMVFDPEVRGRAWTVNSGTHDLPRPKMWRHTPTDQYEGGVCRSDDGGRTWTASSAGMPATAPTDIVLDPRSPRDHRTLYVAAFGRGVYKSIDDGRTWSLKSNGIRQSSPLAWRITLAPDHSLYLVLARRSEDGSTGNSGDGAIYRSIDDAETWQALPLPVGVNAPDGIAVDPSDPQRVYLAAWARAIGTHGEGGGVYRSEDAGLHWTSSLSHDQHIYDVTVDPRLPGTVYAAGFESSAWVSNDSGKQWARIAGFNFKWGHRVVLDPKDAKSIYITTFGGGVWHGKVGTQAGVLDISTPEMEPPL